MSFDVLQAAALPLATKEKRFEAALRVFVEQLSANMGDGHWPEKPEDLAMIATSSVMCADALLTALAKAQP